MRIDRAWMLALAVVGMAVTVTASGAAKTDEPQDEYFTYTVAPGETMSLICLRTYGYYTELLGQGILGANPRLHNLHNIRAGQKIRLRKPIEPPPSTSATLNEDSLYTQRVDAKQGVVTFVEGTAKLRKVQGMELALLDNTVVSPGDVLETAADGRVEVIINRESVVRMDGNTRLAVQAFRDESTPQSKTRVQSTLGTLWTRVRTFKDQICRFELELPTAIAGVHGTIYETDVAADNSADVKVYDGEVSVAGKPSNHGSGPSVGAGQVSGPQEVPGPQEVSMEAWVEIVRSMQRIHIDKKGQAAKPVQFVKKSDEWEHFNEARDRQVADIVARL